MPDAAKSYRAFISYSHAADGQLAPATTALPRNLAGVYAEEPHYLDFRWARSFDIDAAGFDFSGEGVVGVVRLGFTADGHVLATVDKDEDVLLWQTPFWKRLDETEPERKNIAATAAPESSAREVKSPDGTLMVRIGERDGSGDIVLTTGAVIGTLKQDAEPVVAAAFSPDGTWVAVANGTRKVRVHRWETIATLDMLQARAATLVTRALTQAERAQFMPGLWQRLTAWR